MGAAEEMCFGQVKADAVLGRSRIRSVAGPTDDTILLRHAVALILLGSASGVACSSHLASIGYYKARFNTDVLFCFQAIVVTLSQFVAMALRELFDSCDESPRGALARLCACGLGASATLAVTPVCMTKVSLLLNGALTTILGTLLFCSSAQLAQAQVHGLTLLSAGFGAGSLLTAVLASSSRIGLSVAAAYRFYSLAAGVCLIGAMLYVWLAACLSEQPLDEAFDASEGQWLLDENEDEEGEEDEDQNNEEDQHPATRYRALAAGAQETNESRGRASPLPPGTFLSLAVSTTLLPMFALASPHLASVIYQTKCLGDFFGRTLTACCAKPDRGAAAQADGAGGRCRLALAALVWLAAALLVLGWLYMGAKGAPEWIMFLLVVSIYTGGSYWQVMFEQEADSRTVTTEAARKSAARRSMCSKFAGSVVGLAAGTILALAAPL